MTAPPSPVSRRGIAAALASILALAASAAEAAPPRPGRVVLLDSGGSSPMARDCLTRVREELLAGGFEVSSVDPGPRLDPVSVAGAMERQENAIAVVALIGDPAAAGAELWILDRVGSSPEVRRVPVPAGDREHVPEVLAIRAIEVLEASALKRLLESAQPVPAPTPAPPAVVQAPATPPSGPVAARVGLEAGLFLLENVGGPGPAAVPLLRGRVRLGEDLFARLTVAGLGSRPRVETTIGSAIVSQSLGLAELGVELRPGRRWRPGLSLGAGALYVQSDGDGTWPYQGLRASRWAAALDAGAGVSVRAGGGVSFAFEVHGLVAFPHPAVRFYDAEPATLGFPALLASLTMIAWL